MSNSGSEQYDLLDRLAEEVADRYRRGERPAFKEYTDRYPELADDIREILPALKTGTIPSEDYHADSRLDPRAGRDVPLLSPTKASYQETWGVFPGALKRPLELPSN
jgi:hypothetical protein